MARSVVARMALVFLLPIGCGGEAGVYDVSGTVRSGGKPVPNVVVNFQPSPGRPSWGLTDENGRYKLHYTRGHEGAKRGCHKVYLSHRPRCPRDEAKSLPPEVKALIEKYGDQETTPLTFEVTKDGQVIDINVD